MKKLVDKPIVKVRWSIKDASAILKVPSSTIRFWEDNFEELTHEPRKEGEMRHYRAKHMSVMIQIHHLLKVERYTVEGAKMKLRKI